MHINTAQLKQAYQSENIAQIKEILEAKDLSEWPLIFHAVNSAISQMIGVIDYVIKNDLKSEQQSLAVKEFYRNQFFAKNLIKDSKLNNDLTDEFQDFLFKLNEVFTSALEDASEYQQSLGTLHEHRVTSYVQSISPYYFINEGEAQSEILSFEDTSLDKDMDHITARLFESYEVFRAVPEIKAFELEGKLGSSEELLDSCSMQIARYENDSCGVEVSETDPPSYGIYPIDDGKELEDAEVKSFFAASCIKQIQEEFNVILSNFFRTNSEIRLEIDAFNARNDNGSQSGKFYYSYQLEKTESLTM